jgi:hypothetical protein
MDVLRSPMETWRPTPGREHNGRLMWAWLFDDSQRREPGNCAALICLARCQLDRSALVSRWMRFGESVPNRSHWEGFDRARASRSALAMQVCVGMPV